MKLYTEEQVRDILEDIGLSERAIERYKNKITCIELDDNEICDEAESIAHNYFVMQRNHYQGLEEGAKRMAYWLIKKIKQNNNGN
jgi:hypothetical protein